MLFGESGKCYVFSRNDMGQLGLGHCNAVLVPTELCIPSANNDGSQEIITFFTRSTTHGAVLTASQKCFVFGHNRSGQLGVKNSGLVVTPTELCIPISEEENSHEVITFVTCGHHITAVLTRSEKCFILTTGANAITEIIIPNEIITFIASEYNHTLMLTKSQKCFVFGLNGNWQLGLNHCKRVDIPTELNIPSEIITFATCGYNHNMVLTKSNKCFIFGNNNNGQLGLGHTDAINTLANIVLPDEIITFGLCGDFCTMVLTKSGKYFVFGYNKWGRLGLSHNNDVKIPTELCIKDETIVSMAFPSDHCTMVLTKSNKCFVFGRNYNGQLGLAHCNVVNIPTEIKIGERIVKLMNQRSRIISLEWEKQRLLWLGKENPDSSFYYLPKDMIREIIKFSSDIV